MEDSRSNPGQGLGVAGLVLGIIALLISLIPCIGLLALIPGIIAITLSSLALSQANKTNGNRGFIIAALVISIIGTSFAAISGVFLASISRHADRWVNPIVHIFNDNKHVDDNDDEDTDVADDFGKDMEKELEKLEKSIDTTNLNIHINTKMSDEQFDEFLYNYERLIKETYQLRKKTKKGDMKAMAAYSRLSIKLAETASKLASEDSLFTEEQKQRLDELTEKYRKEIESIKED